MVQKIMKTVFVQNQDYITKKVPGSEIDGCLDPHARQELIEMHPTEPVHRNDEPEVHELRAAMGWRDAKDIAVHPIDIHDLKTASGIHFRIYVKASLKARTLPTIFFYHGGAFFGGSLDNVDLPCRALADFQDIQVISVDYGLAPEHPYPEGLLQNYSILEWCMRQDDLNINKTNVTVMGDSAGGNLAYAVALMDRRLGTNFINKLVVLYPVTYMGNNPYYKNLFYDTEQYHPKTDYDLLKPYIDSFNDGQLLIDNWYIHDADSESAYVSPLLMSASEMKHLPKTLFMVGEFDPLRFQGEAFYHLMKLAGGDITYIRYDGMIHAFMDKVGDFRQANDCLKEAANFVVN